MERRIVTCDYCHQIIEDDEQQGADWAFAHAPVEVRHYSQIKHYCSIEHCIAALLERYGCACVKGGDLVGAVQRTIVDALRRDA